MRDEIKKRLQEKGGCTAVGQWEECTYQDAGKPTFWDEDVDFIMSIFSKRIKNAQEFVLEEVDNKVDDDTYKLITKYFDDLLSLDGKVKE